VSQNADRAELLYAIQIMGMRIHPADRSDKTLKFEVRKRWKSGAQVLPHYQKYPLMSSKQPTREIARICELEAGVSSLELEGFEQIFGCHGDESIG